MNFYEGNSEMQAMPMMDPSMVNAGLQVQMVPRHSKKDQDEAGEVALTFCKIYYETVQKKPHLVSQLYLTTPVMIWDGNPMMSLDQIQKFFEQLPSLTFNVMTMDAHPASALAVGPRKTFFIKTAGLYRVSGPGIQKQFTQDIVLTAEGTKWRIASDTFRTIE